MRLPVASRGGTRQPRERMSTAITQGIRVSVKSRFLPEQSGSGRYAFAYTVRIENLGQVSAQLKSRHWIITDGNGKREEVRGEGVVGNQPMLRPGEQFEYTSGAVLKTPHGSMHGTYRIDRKSTRLNSRSQFHLV